MKTIIEAWLSPSRREVYHSNFFECSTNPDWDGYDASEFISSDIFELFDKTEQDGLWKIIVEVEFEYHCDYFGEWDCDTAIGQVFFKSKCRNFSDLRRIWDILRYENRDIDADPTWRDFE